MYGVNKREALVTDVFVVALWSVCGGWKCLIENLYLEHYKFCVFNVHNADGKRFWEIFFFLTAARKCGVNDKLCLCCHIEINVGL